MQIADCRLRNAVRVLAAGCLLLTVAVGFAVPQPKRLEWIDPLGRQPTGYKVWAAVHRAQDEVTHSGKVLQTDDENVVEVAVNAEVFPDLTAELTQYTSDLQAAGYAVRIDTLRGSDPTALRTLLQGIANLKGVLLVGELPVAWYEDDWGGSAPEEFPCDLYFADLNGTFVDSDHDGLYDDHTGNVAPEIWVGRLYTRSLTWDDEVRLLKHYFYKNHLYRTGGLILPDRGLCFNDEDWSGSGNCGMTAIYPTVTVIEDSRTTAANYRTELVNGYEWIHVMSHSSAWGNTFRSSSSNYTGTVFNCEMYALQPRCHFYNLFACSGARFTEENYSAGWEVFNDDWGLFAVGSTKTGSMYPGTFEGFYAPIGAGNCVGDAFKTWFTSYGESDRDWHYGLSLIGDPTLKPRHAIADRSPLTADRRSPTPDPDSPFSDLRPLTADVVGANPETDANPAMVTAPDGKVWAVWVSSRTPANGRMDIYSAYRTTGGWSAAMPVGTAYYWEYNPALAIDNAGRPVCVWSVFEDSYHYTLHYSVWNGSSWSASTQIADNLSEDLQSTLTRDSTGKLWCFWQSRHGPWGDIWARYWNGSVWSSASKVTAGDTALHLHPCAATDDSGRAWVFYARYDQGKSEVWGSYYTGTSWVRSGPVSGTRHRALRPAAARGQDRFWVAWQDFDDGNGEIYASSRVGSTWSAPVRVSTSPALDVHPAMARDGAQGAPWIVWQSKASGNWNVFASCCDGSLWTEPFAVDSNGGFNLNPTVAGIPQGISVAWQDFQTGGNWEIYAKCLPLTGIGAGPRRCVDGIRLAGSPNPSSGQAKLSYALGGAGSGRLAVYDRQGRLVLDLGTVQGSGTLRCPELATGVYFARLSCGSELAETKLVLTR